MIEVGGRALFVCEMKHTCALSVLTHVELPFMESPGVVVKTADAREILENLEQAIALLREYAGLPAPLCPPALPQTQQWEVG